MKTKLSEESNIFWSLKYKVTHTHTHTHIYVYKIFHRIHLPIISIFNLPWYGGPCITTVWKAKSSTALSMGAWFINLKFRICFKLDEREILINIVNYYHLTFYLMCSSIPACDLSELEGLDISHKKITEEIKPFHLYSVQFSSVQFSHSVVSNSLRPHDCSTPGFPVHHQLLEFAQAHVHRVGDTISSYIVPFSSCLQSFPASGSFLMS